MIDCKERVDAYFRNMNEYHDDNDIRVRFLDKIFQAAIDDDYSQQERDYVLTHLLEDAANCEENSDYKALDLAYAYKIKCINGSEVEVPVVKNPTLVDVAIFNDEEPPIKDPVVINFIERIRPDEELIKLFNVRINRDHFNRNSFKKV